MIDISEKMNDEQRASVLLFEVIERAIRLHSHVDRSCKVVSRPGARRTAQVRISREVQKLLERHINESLKRYRDVPAPEHRIANLINDLESLAEIHTRFLVAVPRPHEPIEIISYLRQILFSHLEPDSDEEITIPDIFASETLGDQAHWLNRGVLDASVLEETIERGREVRQFMLANEDIGDKAEDFINKKSAPRRKDFNYVSLPRVDLGNPCRWPSLLHEIGHFRLDEEKVWTDFCADRDGVQLVAARKCIESSSVDADGGTIDHELRSWLYECWCDAYAVVNAGPSAYFAQFHAFLFGSPRNYLSTREQGSLYPPAWFRLRLLMSLSEARLQLEDDAARANICAHMSREKDIFYTIFDVDERSRSELFELLHIFRDFIRRQFPRENWPSTANVSSEALNHLVDDIGKGLPIPAISSSDIRTQQAANPAEILLAGWMHRSSTYRKDFLETIAPWFEKMVDFSDLIRQLRAKVDRADESLKRSLQMAEWFKILDERAKQDAASSKSLGSVSLDGGSDDKVDEVRSTDFVGLLPDIQINALLEKRVLRVIPLIDADRQVSGSVIDLRLGHNFEIFFSNVHGQVDPLNYSRTSESLDGDLSDADSMEMDVDFLKSISIGPGQFILAHTLEYIKLPPDVAAQIEGRSSFARLGLQIHMTANLVEAGFDGCLTLEIANCGNFPIKLYPGMRIAQLRFFKLMRAPRTPYGRMSGTKYRGMLSHNKTQQFSDWEIAAFQEASQKFKINP
ncbi:dCTP deaminase [Herbaspirillum camelliae]|uniref:dCTP deaminase n=1 Tax=Herbaspirillum camelliae TaxID=1892903 RepID=UPI0009F8AC51|nr:dCTP deaminase [Herbaspirillum camelliae]